MLDAGYLMLDAGWWMQQTQWLDNQSAILQRGIINNCNCNVAGRGGEIIAWTELEAVPWLQVASCWLPVAPSRIAVLLC